MFVSYELIGVLVYIGHVNYLCKFATCLTNFAYLWILVWIHKDPCEYAYGKSEIHLFFELIGVLVSIGHGNFGYGFWFMIKLGNWFPLANYIGVLVSIGVFVSIGHKLIYFGLIFQIRANKLMNKEKKNMRRNEENTSQIGVLSKCGDGWLWNTQKHVLPVEICSKVVQ